MGVGGGDEGHSRRQLIKVQDNENYRQRVVIMEFINMVLSDGQCQELRGEDKEWVVIVK